MSSLENTTFGRGNYGCPDSDSDIEAPNVFVSIVELDILLIENLLIFFEDRRC